MIVRLAGGLGNQFFQYAFGRAYEEKTGEKVSFDEWSFCRDKLRNYELDNYNIKKGPKRIFRRIICNIVWEIKTHIGAPVWLDKLAKMEYEKEVFELQNDFVKNSYAVGFWQNEEYFSKYTEIIKNELTYNGVLTKRQQEIIREMKSQQSVAMHIRRTDYLTNSGKSVYENISKSYYLAAIEYLHKHLGTTPAIYVFSDDIEWCKKEYEQVANVTFIDEIISNNQHTDMELMRNCKHFIIANSTFSWWGAWRSENKDKVVICPKKWFVDCDSDEQITAALARKCIRL